MERPQRQNRPSGSSGGQELRAEGERREWQETRTQTWGCRLVETVPSLKPLRKSLRPLEDSQQKSYMMCLTFNTLAAGSGKTLNGSSPACGELTAAKITRPHHTGQGV